MNLLQGNCAYIWSAIVNIQNNAIQLKMQIKNKTKVLSDLGCYFDFSPIKDFLSMFYKRKRRRSHK